MYRVGEVARVRAAFFQGIVGVTPNAQVNVDLEDESGNLTPDAGVATLGPRVGEAWFSFTPDAAGHWLIVFKTAATNVNQQELWTTIDVEGALTSARAALLDHLDMDISAIAAAAGVPVTYAPTSVTIVAGNDESPGGETVADLAAHDDTYMQVGETPSGGAGLEFRILRNASIPTEAPVACRISGHYNGSAAHDVSIQAWNYTTSAWETRGTMKSRTSDFDYVIQLTSDNHDSVTGAMQVRLLHSVATYNASHYVRVDWVSFEKVEGDNQLLADVAAIEALVNTNLDATITSRLAGADYTVPPTADANATSVWAHGSRTLTSFGTLVADVAAAVWASLGSAVAGTMGYLLRAVYAKTLLPGALAVRTPYNGGIITILPGDAYEADHDNAIEIPIGTAPDIDDATLAFEVFELTLSPAVVPTVSGTGAARVATIELSRVQTLQLSDLVAGVPLETQRRYWRIQATWTESPLKPQTIAKGELRREAPAWT